MIAYKFRGADPFERIVDILLNKRLYCSPFNELNDPSEGHYMLTAKNKDKLNQLKGRIAEIVKAQKQALRVCSLCATYDSVLMWAHYANGFDGVAIEVEVAGAFPVKYDSKLPHVMQKQHSAPSQNYSALAKEILSHKLEMWKPENELRLVHRHMFAQVAVKRAIVGPRVSDTLVAALKAICRLQGVEINFAKMARGKLTVCAKDWYVGKRRSIVGIATR